MRTLIIGASSLTGSCLCRLLDEQGEDYLGVVLPEELDSEAAPRRTALDILQSADVLSLLADYRPDRVFDFAEQSSVREAWNDPGYTVNVNINGTIRVLEAAREACPQATICLLGAGEEYGRVPFSRFPVSEEEPSRPLNLYAATKSCQTMLTQVYHRAYGMRVVTARAFNIIGPGQADKFAVSDFCRQTVRIRQGRQKAYFVGNLNIRRDFVDVRDLVRASLLLSQLGRGGEVYNVGSGRAVSLLEILTLLREITGVEADVSVRNDRIRHSDIPKTEADISKITRDTGWSPKIPLRQSVLDMLQYWQQKEEQKSLFLSMLQQLILLELKQHCLELWQESMY